MKPAIILTFFVMFHFISNAEASNQTKVISGNDTAIVVIKKNFTYNKVDENFLNLPVSVVPDTTHDIIIIFRSINREIYDSKLLKNLAIKQSEAVNINYSAVSKNSREV